MRDSCPAPLEKTYGVIGHPLAQSLSPVLHTWAFAQKGVRGLYTAWDTPPEQLAEFIRRFRQTPFDGASVTIPHKEAVIPLLDGLTPTAETIGAVNTLFWDKGKLLGHNTDLEGFLTPLKDMTPPDAALVLGAGGAARAVLAGLAARSVPRVIVCARTQSKAEALIRDFAASPSSLGVLPWEGRLEADRVPSGSLWVVNSTPLGMRGKAEGESPLPARWFAARKGGECLAYDLVYNPLKTAFLAAAENAGWRLRDGLDMFVAQAAAQFRLWTGLGMPVEQARTFLANCLAPEAAPL